jgi:hypothetical protein
LLAEIRRKEKMFVVEAYYPDSRYCSRIMAAVIATMSVLVSISVSWLG